MANRGFRTKVAIVVIVFTTLVILGVKFYQSQSHKYIPITVRPSIFPEAIVAPPNAINNSYHSPEVSKSMPPGRYSTYFMVKEFYPAENTLAFIRQTLESQGWYKLKFLLYKPIKQAMTSWEFQEEEPDRIYFTEHWINQTEDAVTIFLFYHFEKSGKKEDFVHVNVGFVSNSAGIHKQMARYKQMHPDEFTNKSQVVEEMQ